jgi:hypothetical protein
MEDDAVSSETYEEQIAHRREAMSPIILSYRQRIGIGLVIVVLLLAFGGLTVRIF